MTTRPTKNTFSSGVAGWDGPIGDNDEVLFDGPIPIHEHSGDETDLQSTFPFSMYGNCFVWVNDTTLGWTLYHTDGNSAWKPYGDDKRKIVNTASTRAQVSSDQFVRFTATGDYDFLAVASWPGETVVIRNDSGGNVNLDPNSTENINGSSSALVLADGETATVFNTGSELFASIQT